MVPKHFEQPVHQFFIPSCAGGSGHGRLVGNHAPYPITGPESREGRGKTAAQCPKNRHAAISKISNLSRDLREVISIPADAGTKQVFSH